MNRKNMSFCLVLSLVFSSLAVGVPSVLFYRDVDMGTNGVDVAMSNLGWTAMNITTTSDFTTQVGSGSWDFVVVAQQDYVHFTSGSSEYTALQSYINGGGKVFATTWATGSFEGLFGATKAGTNGTTIVVDSNPLFSGMSNIALHNPGWGIYNIAWTPTDTAKGIGQITGVTSGTDGSAIVVYNNGNTALFGPLFDSFSDPNDIALLIERLLSGIQQGDLQSPSNNLPTNKEAAILNSSAVVTVDNGWRRLGYFLNRRLSRSSVLASNNMDMAICDANPETIPTLKEGNGVLPWFEVLDVYAKYDATSKANSMVARTSGAIIGIDIKATDNIVVGPGFAYTQTQMEENHSFSQTEFPSYEGYLYANWRQYTSPGGWFADGIAGFGQNDYDTRRQTALGIAKSNHNGYEYSIFGSAGYDYFAGDWTITPTLGLGYIALREKGYKESGASDSVDVSPTLNESMRHDLGVMLSRSLIWYNMKVCPNVHIGWQHEYLDTESLYLEQGGMSGSFRSRQFQDDTFKCGIGADLNVTKSLVINVSYEGEFQNDYDAHTISANLAYSF
jgi:uncharacterized protein YhjY with autotransporter beta-barrel domain